MNAQTLSVNKRKGRGGKELDLNKMSSLQEVK